MTTTRCKMQVQEHHQLHWSTTAKRVVLQCVYDQAIPEDQRFYKATPNGQMTMLVDNPAALEGPLKLGGHVYIDITPVEEAAKP